MTGPAFPDPLSEAVAKALAAAAAATDAAHEAEAALTARGAAADAMRATARRMTVVAAATCGTALVVLVLAGFMSLRSAGALRAATEAQNAAGMVFVGQLADLKGTLGTLGDAAQAMAAARQDVNARFTDLTDRVAAEAEATRKSMAEAGPGIAQAAAQDTARRIGEMEVILIEALADIQLSLAQARQPSATADTAAGQAPDAGQGAAEEAAATAALDAATARLSAVVDRLELLAAAGPLPAGNARTPADSPTGSPASRPAGPTAAAPAARAPQAPVRPTPNPFRFP